jgi:hypothetical protein
MLVVTDRQDGRDWIILPCVATFEQLLAAACALARCTEAELMGRSHERRIAWPRQELMLALQEKGWSHAEIGRRFSRNHTTVLDGIERAKARGDAWRHSAPWAEVVPELEPCMAFPAPRKTRPLKPPALPRANDPHAVFIAAVHKAHPEMFRHG